MWILIRFCWIFEQMFIFGILVVWLYWKWIPSSLLFRIFIDSDCQKSDNKQFCAFWLVRFDGILFQWQTVLLFKSFDAVVRKCLVFIYLINFRLFSFVYLFVLFQSISTELESTIESSYREQEKTNVPCVDINFVKRNERLTMNRRKNTLKLTVSPEAMPEPAA